MSMFVQTDKGKFVLSSAIVEIRKGGGKRSIIKTKHDDVYIVSERARTLKERLERESGSVIPAEPGFNVAYLHQLEGENDWSVRAAPCRRMVQTGTQNA